MQVQRNLVVAFLLCSISTSVLLAQQSPGDGRLATDPRIFAVSADQGSVLETVTDFALPSQGAPEVQWRAMRTYDQRTTGPGDTVQGQNWFHPYLQGLTLANTGNPSASDVTWRADAHHTYTFTNSGSYTFAMSDRTFGVLSHAHTGDASDTYRIEFPSGLLLVFYDYSHSTAVERLKLKYIEDLYGNRLSAFYDVSGNVDYITDPSGHYFRYTYLTTTGNAGNLDHVVAYKSSGTSNSDRIAEIDYVYKDSGDSYDGSTGTQGDLIKVAVKTSSTAQLGTSLDIERDSAYRYGDGTTYNSSTYPWHVHELKSVSWPEHYQRADDDPNFSDPLTATDAQLASYCTYKYEYDSSNRCSKITVADGGAAVGGGCSSCSGGGGGSDPGAYVLAYDTGGTSGRNAWNVRCKVDFNGVRHLFDVNDHGETFQEVRLDPNDPNNLVWVTRYERDPNTGQVTTLYSPAAISAYNDPNHTVTFVSAGLVTDYTYDPNSHQLASSRIRHESDGGGAAYYTGLWEYAATSGSFGYRSPRYVLSKSYAYPGETTNSADAGRLTTQYDYVFWADAGDLDGDADSSEASDRPMVVKTTRPTATTGQNGPNTAPVSFAYLTAAGQACWFKSPDGVVNYQAYNDATGQMLYSVRDVYTGTDPNSFSPTAIYDPNTGGGLGVWAAWSGSAPKDLGASPAYDFQTTGSSSDYLRLENKRFVDMQGRTTKSRRYDPAKSDTGGTVDDVTAYLDGETRSYPACSDPNHPQLPVSRTKVDKDGRVTESITVDPNGITFAGPPDGTETLTDQTRWISWSTNTYNANLQLATSHAYAAIPSSGSGSAGTNFYETTYTYTLDPNSGVSTSAVQVRDPEGGYTRTTRDYLGRVIQVEATATESLGSPTAWKTMTATLYDQSTPGSGASKGGPGTATEVRKYYADASYNSTKNHFDWRNRLCITDAGGPVHLTHFDNLGRAVSQGTYTSIGSLAAGDDPLSSSTNRRSLSSTAYDNAGQVYQTKQCKYDDPNTFLTTSIYHDLDGRTVAVQSPGAGVMETMYDAASRVKETLLCTALDPNAFVGGAFNYTGSGNQPIEITILTLLKTGQVAKTARYELNAGANARIDPAALGTGTMHSEEWDWYSVRGKIQHTAFGTTASGGLAGPMHPTGGGFALPGLIEYDPNDPYPSSGSDTQLVAKWSYLSNGRLDSTTSVTGAVTKYAYDALGRKTAQTEDYGGLAEKTDYEYNSSSLTKVTAENGAATDQQTLYVYGHAINSRWVTKIEDPNSSDGTPDPNCARSMTYNNDGTVATATDENGSVHSYDYDVLRRKTQDRLTTLGTNIDGAVRRIGTTYDDAGRLQKITSYDNATVGSGSVVNEVQYEYNKLGQLTKDAQAHAGAVDPNSLSVQYYWTEDPNNNHSRLDHVVYPNGRTLYDYYTNRNAGSTFQDEIDNAFSRVGQIGADPNGIYVDYTFSGRNRLVQRASPSGAGFKGNGTIVDYDAGTAGEYAGFDFNGRVVNQDSHEDGDPNVVQAAIQYRSNRDGTPKFAEPQNNVVRGKADFYTYDGLGRISELDAGRLNSGRTSITTEWSTPESEVYTRDALGNLTAIDHKNSGTSASETRSVNCRNQLTSRTITAHKPVYWINDPFTDNNTNQWVVADLVSGSDGTWSASSGKLQCDTAVSVSGAPSNGNGSMLLADIGALQDIQLDVSVVLSGTADNGGLVFGYTDAYNFWLLIANRTATRMELWQVSGDPNAGRSWSLRGNTGAGSVSSSGGTFDLRCQVRSGGVEQINSSGVWVSSTIHIADYAATLPAGKIGVWAGSGSAGVKFDDFKALSLASFADIDGRWWEDVGDTALVSGKLQFNLVGASSNNQVEKHAIRRGFRGDKYVLEYDHVTFANDTWAGALLHYQNPENFMAVIFQQDLEDATVATPLLVRRQDGVLSTILAAAACTP